MALAAISARALVHSFGAWISRPGRAGDSRCRWGDQGLEIVDVVRDLWLEV
jgi:hypothetical protein